MKPYLVCHSVNGIQFCNDGIDFASCLYFYMQAENLDEVKYYCHAKEEIILIATFNTDLEARVYCESLINKFRESLDKRNNAWYTNKRVEEK